MTNDQLARITNIVFAACACIVTLVLVKHELWPGADSQTGPRWVATPDWKGLAADGHRMGVASAPVTIVEFSDFQCPFCGRFEATLDTLRTKYRDQVSVVYRHYPLVNVHHFAMPAALASECAGEQGRFAPFHDAVFTHQDSLGKRSWQNFASDAGVPNIPRFSECLEEGRYRRRVDADIAAGNSLRVNGTPTIFVNDARFDGAPTTAMLDQQVAIALRGERPGMWSRLIRRFE